MNPKPRLRGLAAGTAALALGVSLAMSGCVTATSPTIQAPELPTASTPVIAIPDPEEPSAADLWSDDRSRIDTPILDIDLDAETQWAIFEACGQDASTFCMTMAIAYVESRYDTDLVGDDGKSIGMMQINTKWHTARMEALGVTDLTDPVQSATVAIDYLKELAEVYGFPWESNDLLMAYNMGPSGARKALADGRTSTDYSEAVLEIYWSRMEEMEWAR